MPPAQWPPPLCPHSAHGTFASSGWPGLRAEVGEALLERRVGAVARVAPHLAVGLLRLLVGRRQQGAVVLLRQRLPVQVVGAGQPRLARPLAAPVLVDDDAAERLHARGNPDRVVDRVGQFARLGRTPRTARGSTAGRPAGRRRTAASGRGRPARPAPRSRRATPQNVVEVRFMSACSRKERLSHPVRAGQAAIGRRSGFPHRGPDPTARPQGIETLTNWLAARRRGVKTGGWFVVAQFSAPASPERPSSKTACPVLPAVPALDRSRSVSLVPSAEDSSPWPSPAGPAAFRPCPTPR